MIKFLICLVLFPLAWLLVAGCVRYQKLPPGFPKSAVGPDTFPDGPDWWLPPPQSTCQK